MLPNPTLRQLQSLRLDGMAAAYAEQIEQGGLEQLTFDERLALLVDREAVERENRRLTYRLRRARLRVNASIEDIDYASGRRLDKALVRQLATCRWINAHQNVLIVGATGTGKTFVACALAHKACLSGFSSAYYRLNRLLQELHIAQADGSYQKLMRRLLKTDVLVLDDLGLNPITMEDRRELLELLDDRHGSKSTIVTSQLPVKDWHEAIGEATLADAILDRLVHNAHRIELKGVSMRKRQANINDVTEQTN